LRSLLFVPGNRPERFKKARASGADAVILDLEDAVPWSQKEAARAAVLLALDEFASASPSIVIRINSDRKLRDQDVAVAVHRNVTGVLLPKCESAEDVLEVAAKIEEIEKERNLERNATQVLALIESARALMQLQAVAQASSRLSGLVLGAEDWCLDMGIDRTREGVELDFARWSIAVCARGCGLQAIDTPFTDFRDTEGLRAECRRAKRMGFSGKLAIHPAQVDTIHDVFAPSEAEVAAAASVVVAFDAAAARGDGVVSLDGRMIDRPIADRARDVIARARKGTRSI
jgi:citrate lyase subunit beta/citryl-CoA lyase